MPELPDITVYVEALAKRIRGQVINSVRINSPFLLRTAVPDINEVVGQPVVSVSRMGKRVVFGLSDNRSLVLHLMISGRLQWYPANKKVPAKSPLLCLVFDNGTLTLTEAGSKKRASLHLVDGPDALSDHDPKGLEVLSTTFDEFRERALLRNHTLKRALTSPALLSGIGNAYSDEILHHAGLSPILQTQKMANDELQRLYESCVLILELWTDKLRKINGDGFPQNVTAFRDGMAVHGRYGLPCPVCSTSVQRIRYVGNETNYCPRCQTGGKVLADRSLSRLLKKDWPRTIEELERGY